MSKDWSYAKMSHDIANAGGPDMWLEVTKKAAYDAGASDTKNALALPLLAAGMGIGAVCVIGGQKIHKWITKKKQARLLAEQEAADAEELLKKELSQATDELQTNTGGNEE